MKTIFQVVNSKSNCKEINKIKMNNEKVFIKVRIVDAQVLVHESTGNGAYPIDMESIDEPTKDLCIQHLFEGQVFGAGYDVDTFFDVFVAVATAEIVSDTLIGNTIELFLQQIHFGIFQQLCLEHSEAGVIAHAEKLPEVVFPALQGLTGQTQNHFGVSWNVSLLTHLENFFQLVHFLVLYFELILLLQYLVQ